MWTRYFRIVQLAFSEKGDKIRVDFTKAICLQNAYFGVELARASLVTFSQNWAVAAGSFCHSALFCALIQLALRRCPL